MLIGAGAGASIKYNFRLATNLTVDRLKSSKRAGEDVLDDDGELAVANVCAKEWKQKGKRKVVVVVETNQRAVRPCSSSAAAARVNSWRVRAPSEIRL